MLNRNIAPIISLPKSFDLLKAEQIKLRNDIPVYVINAGKQDVIRLELIFSSGTRNEDTKGVSYFSNKMLLEGTKKYSSKQITEYLDLYGAFYELHHGPDMVNITFYSLKKYLREVVTMAQSLILESTFPEDEIKNLKNIYTQNLKVNLNKTNFIASNKFKETLFGIDHPYGKSLSEDDVNKLDKELLLDFYRKNIQNKSFEIVLSGNISDTTIDILEKEFGDINCEPFNLKVIPPPTFNKSDLVVVEKADSLQSSIRLGYKCISKTHPDYFKLIVLNEILGGYFGSRLMKNIREDKGFTYGISSNVVNNKSDSYFVIGTDVKKEFTEQTLSEISKEIEILRNQEVPKEELETVKSYMIGSFLGSINTPFALADKFKSIHYHNLGYDFYDSYFEAIEQTTSKALRETANKYLNYDNMLKVVVGGLK